jgi:S1-C subfamily serine protease
VSDVADERPVRDRRGIASIVIVAVIAGLVGAFIGRGLAPNPQQAAQPRRPIVQIVRPQPGLPSLASLVDANCPSMAIIVPGDASPNPAAATGSPPPSAVPAFAVSIDGWLVTTESIPAAQRLDALFSDGTRVPVAKVLTDPVSGLAIAKVDANNLTPVAISDQAFPRVGDFGFALQAPNARGCTAQIAMIGSDFLADGGGPVSYVRTQSGGTPIPPGAPFLGSDGQVIGVGVDNSQVPGTIIPAAIAGTIIDELIRGQPSPSIAFGFRAADFSAPIFARIANTRSRGAGVALVQPGSTADKAGLQAGDAVVAVNGSPVSSASELGRALDATQKTAALDVIRNDSRLTVTVQRSRS